MFLSRFWQDMKTMILNQFLLPIWKLATIINFTMVKMLKKIWKMLGKNTKEEI